MAHPNGVRESVAIIDGEQVSSDCIPYSAIPHTSKLFNDFLFEFEKVARFYRKPLGMEWLADEARLVKYDQARRARVAGVLERQNREWGAPAATLEAVRRFREGAVAVVTGQQVGLFGGPLYSVLKAASVLRVAGELTRQGIQAVPIFWLATEDHDLLEVNHAVLPAGNGELRTLVSSSRGKSNAPVGTVRFGEEIAEVARNAAELLGESNIADFVVESYKPGETYGSAFARLFTKIFGEHG